MEWGSRTRGVLLSDLATSLGLILANVGSVPKFARCRATSIIDVTFSRGVDVTEWKVMETDSLNDHAYLFISTAPRTLHPPRQHLIWSRTLAGPSDSVITKS